jgi:hypothetical protein
MEEDLGHELRALVEERPGRLVGVESISRHGAVRPRRATFRLRFSDGTVLKGRRLDTVEDADRLEALSARLDPERFTRVIARHGRALLESWIPGEMLRDVAPAHLRWAGETLGAVHRRVGREAPPVERVERELAELRDLGALPGSAASRLREIALADAPREAETCVTHRDLCPENIVVASGGRLFVVDNDAIRIGAADEDLARTFYRWSMGIGARAEFLDAYRVLRDPAPFLEHERFWMVAALAHAAGIRWTRGYERAHEPLDRLLDELSCSA